ncbi:MAG: ABC transporter permease [Planctomycetales bacterium]|nr:ABC transporter permease [Planctomycetales bacterium]
MNPRDLFGLAGGALAAHRVRTRLTVAAVAIGVAAVLLLTSLGTSARDYVVRQFAGIGANLIGIVPGRVETTGGPPLAAGTERPLTLDDAEALVRRIPAVTLMAPLALAVTSVEAGGLSRAVTVVGSTPEFVPIRALAMAAGSNLPAMDSHSTAQVCVLGARLRRELFGDRNPLGEAVRVAESRFRVIGLLAPKGMSLGVDLDEMVLVPVANVLRLTNRPGLFRIAVQCRSFEDVPALEADVRRVLADRHGEEDFTVLTQQAVMASLARIVGLLTAALAAIAAISLGVAGIGVMNVMLVAVAERTPEVGLMKAVGASRGQVLALFLTEAAALSLGGGVAGVVLGLAGAQAVEVFVPALRMASPVWAIEAALGVSLLVGLVFGALPAVRAARLMPVEALRGRR